MPFSTYFLLCPQFFKFCECITAFFFLVYTWQLYIGHLWYIHRMPKNINMCVYVFNTYVHTHGFSAHMFVFLGSFMLVYTSSLFNHFIPWHFSFDHLTLTHFIIIVDKIFLNSILGSKIFKVRQTFSLFSLYFWQQNFPNKSKFSLNCLDCSYYSWMLKCSFLFIFIYTMVTFFRPKRHTLLCPCLDSVYIV